MNQWLSDLASLGSHTALRNNNEYVGLAVRQSPSFHFVRIRGISCSVSAGVWGVLGLLRESGTYFYVLSMWENPW